MEDNKAMFLAACPLFKTNKRKPDNKGINISNNATINYVSSASPRPPPVEGEKETLIIDYIRLAIKLLNQKLPFETLPLASVLFTRKSFKSINPGSLREKLYHKKYHHAHHHQQNIISYLAALQMTHLAAGVLYGSSHTIYQPIDT